MSDINLAIRSRRSVYPPQYINKPIPKEIIEELLINANHAPTHKLTEPWRFKVFTGDALVTLGEFLAKKYLEITSNPVEGKLEKIKKNPTLAGAIIAIILHRDVHNRVPEWEEIAAVAMAVENLWIALPQYELGGYWSTPPMIHDLGDHIHLEENERCIGLFYLGYCEPSDRLISKKPVEEKTTWIST